MELTGLSGQRSLIASALFLALFTSSVAYGQVSGFLLESEDLFVRDLVTLDSMLVGPTGSVVSGGLAMREDGVLFSVSDFADELWQIDPETGAGTLVGPLGFDVTSDAGLTFDACGDLWLSSGRGLLFQVDPETAATAQVADFGDNWIIGLTAYGEQLLALVRVGFPRQLAWIDTDTGTLDLFGDQIGIPTFQGGLDFDQNGGLWALLWVNDPIPVPWVSSVIRFDPATGQALEVSEDIGSPLGGNLAISPPQGVCGSTPVAIPTTTAVSRFMLGLMLAAAGSLVISRYK